VISQFPIHHSPFTIHHSLFTIPNSPFTIPNSPFPTHHSQLTIHPPLFPKHEETAIILKQSLSRMLLASIEDGNRRHSSRDFTIMQNYISANKPAIAQRNALWSGENSFLLYSGGKTR
jgi:hypothetical protein